MGEDGILRALIIIMERKGRISLKEGRLVKWGMVGPSAAGVEGGDAGEDEEGGGGPGEGHEL